MRLDALPQAVPLVLGFCVLAVISELATWVWVYSKPSFKNAQEAVHRLPKKGEEALLAPKSKSGKGKKAERAQTNVKQTVMREVASLRFKQGLIMVASLAITYRLVGWYISGPVAKLPFEPAWLLKKLAHRGLDSPAANDCAFAFILMLCQTGLKPTIALLLNLGPSRRMLEMGGLQTAIDDATKAQQ